MSEITQTVTRWTTNENVSSFLTGVDLLRNWSKFLNLSRVSTGNGRDQCPAGWRRLRERIDCWDFINNMDTDAI